MPHVHIVPILRKIVNIVRVREDSLLSRPGQWILKVYITWYEVSCFVIGHYFSTHVV